MVHLYKSFDLKIYIHTHKLIIQVDNYAVATNVGPMPTYLTTELDSSLIPLIIQLQTNELDQKLIIELLFFILNK